MFIIFSRDFSTQIFLQIFYDSTLFLFQKDVNEQAQPKHQTNGDTRY